MGDLGRKRKWEKIKNQKKKERINLELRYCTYNCDDKGEDAVQNTVEAAVAVAATISWRHVRHRAQHDAPAAVL